MPLKLRPEEIVTIDVLHGKGVSNCEIGRHLGVTESTVRYHIRRKAACATDGRRNKAHLADALAHVVDAWMQGEKEAGGMRANVSDLHDYLVTEHGYQGSVRSLQRYVRARYPRPKIRPYRRVETPPGAQAQLDWAEFAGVDIGDGPQKLFAFMMALSHSRKEAVIWSRRTDQLAWHHVHNEALARIGGVAAVMRIDNLKTGISVGAGPWGTVNPAYEAYAKAVGFHVDACLPRCPEDKGKVERRVAATRGRIDPAKQRFGSLAELQAWTDERLAIAAQKRLCPATGKSVEESWEAEKRFLRPLPILPQVFDVVATRKVHRDCTVNFEGRAYSVPFVLVDRLVEIRGCAEVVQILYESKVVAEHPRHTAARVLINQAHYDGPGSERVDPPTPLGKLGRRLVEIFNQPVQQRPLDLYAALAEVTR
jgi:transposase